MDYQDCQIVEFRSGFELIERLNFSNAQGQPVPEARRHIGRDSLTKARLDSGYSQEVPNPRPSGACWCIERKQVLEICGRKTVECFSGQHPDLIVNPLENREPWKICLSMHSHTKTLVAGPRDKLHGFG